MSPDLITPITGLSWRGGDIITDQIGGHKQTSGSYDLTKGQFGRPADRDPCTIVRSATRTSLWCLRRLVAL